MDENFESVKKAAEQGDADAQFRLGDMYYKGKGISRDYTEAARWFRLAAEQGHADAQFNLGVMYRYGKDIPQDATKAARWFRLAAKQGHADAQQMIGRSRASHVRYGGGGDGSGFGSGIASFLLGFLSYFAVTLLRGPKREE